MTTMPSRAAIDAAGDLDWQPRTKAEPLTITVHAVVAGFATELCFTGSIDQLPALAARLIALGATPTATTVEKPSGPLRKSAPVSYADDGTPLCGNANCSRHGKPLEPSQHGRGFFCKGKDTQTGNSKDYCKTTAE